MLVCVEKIYVPINAEAKGVPFLFQQFSMLRLGYEVDQSMEPIRALRYDSHQVSAPLRCSA
jgi:hypothetical protein